MVGHDIESSKKRTTGAATPMARDTQEAIPVSQDRTLRETTDAELVEAAERMDAGLRLAVPMLFDGLGPDPVASPTSAEIDGDIADYVAGELSDAREAVLGAGKGLPLEGNIDLHLRFNSVINEIDRAVSILAERRSS